MSKGKKTAPAPPSLWAARGPATPVSHQRDQFRNDGRSRGMTAGETGPLSQTGISLGLRANWRQFSLLVLINAFVGGMVGIERTVVPLIGVEEFHLASTTLIGSFIVSFGVIKACANLISGQLADGWGRQRLL